MYVLYAGNNLLDNNNLMAKNIAIVQNCINWLQRKNMEIKKNDGILIATVFSSSRNLEEIFSEMETL